MGIAPVKILLTKITFPGNTVQEQSQVRRILSASCEKTPSNQESVSSKIQNCSWRVFLVLPSVADKSELTSDYHYNWLL